MRAMTKVMGVILGGLASIASFSSTAQASCIELPKQGRVSPDTQARWSFGRRLIVAHNTPGGSSARSGPQIVGLWQFEFTSVGNDGAPFHIPDGAQLDAGYAQWHSDGTEIMNSSRDPVTGNFCLGTWAGDSDRGFKLNHFGLSWDNTGQLCTPAPGATNCFVGPANIRETVTVDPLGETYEGTVTIDQYDKAEHLIFRLTGTVTARRVNPE